MWQWQEQHARCVLAAALDPAWFPAASWMMRCRAHNKPEDTNLQGFCDGTAPAVVAELVLLKGLLVGRLLDGVKRVL
jgi:hypothetical protein